MRDTDTILWDLFTLPCQACTLSKFHWELKVEPYSEITVDLIVGGYWITSSHVMSGYGSRTVSGSTIVRLRPWESVHLEVNGPGHGKLQYDGTSFGGFRIGD